MLTEAVKAAEEIVGALHCHGYATYDDAALEWAEIISKHIMDAIRESKNEREEMIKRHERATETRRRLER
jgi:hypothetical protein